MITCVVLYLILGVFILVRRRGHLPEWGRGRTSKRILFILFVSNTIAMSLFVLDRSESGGGGTIHRNTYGGGEKQETYEVTVGKEVEGKEIVVDVEERKYTSQEIRKIFREIIQKLDKEILGENKSLDHVEKDLKLLKRWKDYPVQIQWECDSYDVMDSEGHIRVQKTRREGTVVKLKGRLIYEEEEAWYETEVVVYPETKDRAGTMLDNIQELLRAEEKKTREQEAFELPRKIEGENILWKKKPDVRGYYVIVLGLFASGLMVALKRQNEQEEEKARKEQMITDYPEIINKFTLLLSTGMTVKNVWKKIINSYEEQKGMLGSRAAYEEMGYAYHEMQGGIPEAEVYERFGNRCGISVYMKFGAMLAQNMKKGTKGMTDLLRAEFMQAFENRKSRAKRLGEEAGTKLLIPMFGMLAVVLIIVVVPAFLSMQL